MEWFILYSFLNFKNKSGTSLVVQWLRMHLGMQRIWVWSLVGKLRFHMLSLPGGTVGKNLPASAGDTGLIPGPGWFHMSQSNSACAPLLLSPHAKTYWGLYVLGPASHKYWALRLQLLKPVCLDPMLHNKRSHNEEPVLCTQTVARCPQLEKVKGHQRRPQGSLK